MQQEAAWLAFKPFMTIYTSNTNINSFEIMIIINSRRRCTGVYAHLIGLVLAWMKRNVVSVGTIVPQSFFLNEFDDGYRLEDLSLDCLYWTVISSFSSKPQAEPLEATPPSPLSIPHQRTS